MTHSHIGDHTMTTQTQEAQVRAAFEALIAAAENVEMFRETSYVAKNGRRISIQADDGERVDLVHSDQTETLKAATDAAKLALAAWSARPQSEVKDAWEKCPEAMALVPDRCSSCAFREGTVPNGCPETVLDAIKCVIEGVPFMCHHNMVDGKATEVCRGWLVTQRADKEPGKAPWDWTAPKGDK